jgi:hypothetical protein
MRESSILVQPCAYIPSRIFPPSSACGPYTERSHGPSSMMYGCDNRDILDGVYAPGSTSIDHARIGRPGGVKIPNWYCSIWRDSSARLFSRAVPRIGRRCKFPRTRAAGWHDFRVLTVQLATPREPDNANAIIIVPQTRRATCKPRK